MGRLFNRQFFRKNLYNSTALRPNFVNKFENEEVVVEHGETIHNICYDRKFPDESQIIRDEISKVANNFAVAIQRQLIDFCEHNTTYTLDRGFRIDIMINKTDYEVSVTEERSK